MIQNRKYQKKMIKKKNYYYQSGLGLWKSLANSKETLREMEIITKQQSIS